MQTDFTPQQCRAARAAAQLSQARVAAALGINRSYLSQFETGKYRLDDATLARLGQYFAREEFVADSQEPTTARPLPRPQTNSQGIASRAARLRDGFHISADIDETEANSLLKEYAEARRLIADLCTYDLSKTALYGIWNDEGDAKKRTDSVLALMARNFVIAEELQGRDTAQFKMNGDDARREKKTVLDYVRARLAKASASR